MVAIYQDGFSTIIYNLHHDLSKIYHQVESSSASFERRPMLTWNHQKISLAILGFVRNLYGGFLSHRGYPQSSSILVGFSLLNHLFWVPPLHNFGTPIRNIIILRTSGSSERIQEALELEKALA